jgi:hypothetical protein
MSEEGELVHRHRDAVPTAAALDFNSSFESLNNDCLVNIFSYLSTDDLNNIITVVNKACNKARDSESLDQTRTAIITCSDLRTRSTVSSLCAALGNASKTLTTSKFRKLKIVGTEKLENELPTTMEKNIMPSHRESSSKFFKVSPTFVGLRVT